MRAVLALLVAVALCGFVAAIASITKNIDVWSSGSEARAEDPWADGEWRTGPYESAYYSCPSEPEAGCTADDGHYELDELWIGTERGGVAFVDLWFTGDPSSWDGLLGPPDGIAAEFRPLGHGVQVMPLAAPPPGLGIGGAAWLQVTVSAVSAEAFAARPVRPADQVGDAEPRGTKARAPTRMPGTVEPHPTSTDHIDAVTLVSTTPDMMRWVISLTEPVMYEYYVVGYWGSGPSTTALNITLRPRGQNGPDSATD